MTLKQYYFLVQAHEQQQKREQYRFALICSVIANVNRTKGKTFKPDDFMPREPKKKQTWQEQLQVIEQFVALYEGGE